MARIGYVLNKVSSMRLSAKIALISYWNDCSLIRWENVLLRGELWKDAKNSNLWNFESALYWKSGSMPVSFLLCLQIKAKQMDWVEFMKEGCSFSPLVSSVMFTSKILQTFQYLWININGLIWQGFAVIRNVTLSKEMSHMLAILNFDFVWTIWLFIHLKYCILIQTPSQLDIWLQR